MYIVLPRTLDIPPTYLLAYVKNSYFELLNFKSRLHGNSIEYDLYKKYLSINIKNVIDIYQSAFVSWKNDVNLIYWC